MIPFLPEPDYPDFTLYGTPPCAETDPDAFFSEDAPDGSMTKTRGVYRYEREAKLVCSKCPYQAECLSYALKRPELDGIWGGTTERERTKIRKGIPVTIRIPESRHL